MRTIPRTHIKRIDRIIKETHHCERRLRVDGSSVEQPATASNPLLALKDFIDNGGKFYEIESNRFRIITPGSKYELITCRPIE